MSEAFVGLAGFGWVAGAALLIAGCAGGATSGPLDPPDAGRAARERMVEEQIAARGVRDPAVLAAMRSVPRDRFVPAEVRRDAYTDGPLAIGHGQTISQPYIVALMTELARPAREMKVLEVGTGSGYQAAVLAECVREVLSIEIVEPLARRADALLKELGYRNVRVRVGDGYDGWPEEAPFDAILVTAAPDRIPQPLLDQLRVGGRLVIPVGGGRQDLVVVTRTESGYERRTEIPVRFVPMTGKASERP